MGHLANKTLIYVQIDNRMRLAHATPFRDYAWNSDEPDWSVHGRKAQWHRPKLDESHLDWKGVFKHNHFTQLNNRK